MDYDTLFPALESDYYIVFGASYIKGWLADFLIKNGAINIHMGISPYYRGNSCNFWAMYDGHPELVGATIHLLGKGLDSGDILYHALPKAEAVDPFVLGMLAVKVAHESIVSRISTNRLFEYKAVKQDKTKEYKYTRNVDFDDRVAKDYLDHLLRPSQIEEMLKNRKLYMFENPYIA